MYREKVVKIDTLLAQRYGNHPAVLGWHISNEFGGECYCPLCAKEFQRWLAKKHGGDIEKLNFEWWTTFWSHNFNSFDEIEPPYSNGDGYSALVIDWNRFVTDRTADFIRCEVEAVRKHSSLPATANFMHKYSQLNYYVLEREVDFISWDSYPLWHCEDGKRITYTLRQNTRSLTTHSAHLKISPLRLWNVRPATPTGKRLPSLSVRECISSLLFRR